jgi:hypothetical protein
MGHAVCVLEDWNALRPYFTQKLRTIWRKGNRTSGIAKNKAQSAHSNAKAAVLA